jgi:phosphohistidine phosphatase
LFIVRHAKAEADAPGGDFARRLTERGEDDAKQTGKHIADIMSPGLIVSSDAARALSTAKIIAKKTDYAGELVEDHAIYEASVPDLVEVVRALPKSEKKVIIVGHNPGFEGLAYFLAENREAIPRMSTATAVLIEFNITDWTEIDEETGRITGSFTP